MGFHKPFEPFKFADWRLQAAAAAAGFQPQTTSIEFNGVDEAMRNQITQSIGIGSFWSILINFRRRSDTQGLTGINTMLQLFQGASTANRIFIRSNGALANDPIRIETTHRFGGGLKDYFYNDDIFPYDVWHHMIFTWSNTTEDLNMYKNGVLTPRSGQFLQNNEGMQSIDRLVQIGQNGGVQPYSGFIHSIALWNADVSPAAVELYNGGVVSSFDLNAASFAGNLRHWWRLGQDSGDLGKDYADAATNAINVGQSLLNIDASDIDPESPL